MSQQLEITRQQTAAQVVDKVNVFVWIDHEDKPYAAKLGPMLANCRVQLFADSADSLHVVTSKLKVNGFTKVVTTRLDVLLKLLPPGRVKKANITNYTGSIIPFNGVEFLILPPLKQLVTIEYADWMFRHLVRKITHESSWRKVSEFRWWVAEKESEFAEAEKVLATCDLISVDCETAKEPRPHITLVQYTGFKFATGESWTYVLPMDKMSSVYAMRRINALPPSKVLQNGKYDCAYFFAYGAPLHAYTFDLKNAMHAQYSELPKDLAFSSALWLREIMYWKDLSSSGDKQDQFRYGAMDTWATGEAFISWLLQAPAWAKENYITEFELVPSLHMCEMRGIKRDMGTLYKSAEAEAFKINAVLSRIRACVGSPNFNPGSSQQVTRLICILTGKPMPKKDKLVKDMTWEEKKDRQTSDKKALEKASYAHPLNERLLGDVIEYRKRAKSVSNYLTTGDKAKEFGPPGKERILFSLNPDGTDSARLASKAHHFWCGFQIQNIKGDGRDGELELASVKETLVADEGFTFFECDYSQAEDRGVAFSSGDPTLLDIFERGVDSHSFKAAMFFGIPYEEIYDVVKRKTILKPIRELGKRINHGANYNMGAEVLLQTMGIKAVREAQRVLKLKASMTLIEVCKYLLACYERAFPTVKNQYYKSIVLQIKRNKMMVSDTGWVRYCFGNPETSKPALNKYVAHKTQNLNAMILNKAWLKIWYAHGFNPNLKLNAQIHDSILGQVRIGHEYLLTGTGGVADLMTFPVPITDCAGITRDLIVPVDVKILGRTWAGTDE